MANVINSLKLGSGTYVFTTPYATCDTAAAEAAKVAATTPGSNFSLETGARITVKFTVTNTAANPTLNVNSTGAKAIYYRGQPISASYLMANRTYEFIYNGTQYELVGDLDSNTAHNHSAGVGLAYGGNAGISGGTYTYKAKLKDETKNANNSLARPSANANRLYPVEVDKSGYLAVTVPWSDTNTDTDTKNTAGSTDTSSKIFLIGATSQAANPQTYSHDTAYVGTDGCLYSNSQKVATLGDNNSFTGLNMFKKTSTDGNTDYIIKLDNSSTTPNIVLGSAPVGTTAPAVYTKYGESTISKISASGKLNFTFPEVQGGIYNISLPLKSGTIALTSDIPSSTTSSTFDDSIDIWDTTYSGDKYVSIEAAGSGSICVHNDDDGTLLTLNLPAINDGTYTLATTSDIPSASNFVTVANAQTIYGKKTFNGGVQFGTDTVFNNGGIQIPAANAFKVMGMYDVSLPSKSGTIALTSDIPSGGGSGDVTAAGNNIFTGTNQFNGGTSFRGSSNYFITADFMLANARPGDPITTIDANGVHCTIDNNVGTYYQEHQILHQAFTLTLPSKSGTLATTSDIPIKTASLSGTTLSITLS